MDCQVFHSFQTDWLPQGAKEVYWILNQGVTKKVPRRTDSRFAEVDPQNEKTQREVFFPPLLFAWSMGPS
jgi:hypothetical protein